MEQFFQSITKENNHFQPKINIDYTHFSTILINSKLLVRNEKKLLHSMWITNNNRVEKARILTTIITANLNTTEQSQWSKTSSLLSLLIWQIFLSKQSWEMNQFHHLWKSFHPRKMKKTIFEYLFFDHFYE
jgi:hypothetical protein